MEEIHVSISFWKIFISVAGHHLRDRLEEQEMTFFSESGYD